MIVPSKLFNLSNLRKIAEDFFQIIEDEQYKFIVILSIVQHQ